MPGALVPSMYTTAPQNLNLVPAAAPRGYRDVVPSHVARIRVALASLRILAGTSIVEGREIPRAEWLVARNEAVADNNRSFRQFGVCPQNLVVVLDDPAEGITR